MNRDLFGCIATAGSRPVTFGKKRP